jgi:hypothetical protein
LQCSVAARTLEQYADFRLRCTVSDSALIGPIAQRKAKRIDQNGFSGAGFARQHVQTSPEFDFEFVDNRVIAYLQ